MALYDSSVLVDYLGGVDETVAYIERHSDERAVAPPLVLFEVYQGEAFKSGPADFDAVDGALGWLTVADQSPETARAAGELQNALQKQGTPLAARDAFIAGTAKALGERLVVADSDFRVDGITDVVDVDFLSLSL